MEHEPSEIRSLILEINHLFEEYQKLSNDEFRDLLFSIKSIFQSNHNDENILDSFLPQVYAIVKETTRRFAQGKVVVTANNNDRKLADKFDFVSIEGDKAVYSNKWYAGGDNFEWKMVHYDVQLLAGIYLNRGYVTEMATGEGKTLVAILPAFFNALSGRGVHLMTVNDYLSKRDCELTRPIYMFHGLSVDCVEYYSRYSNQRNKAYQADITFGTNSTFAFDYLYDHLSTDPEKCIQKKHQFALIDELDSILIDNADDPHIISNRSGISRAEDFINNKNVIEELLSDKTSVYYEADKLKNKAWFTNKGKSWLSNRLSIEGLFDCEKIYKIDQFDLLSEESKMAIREKLDLQNVLQQLLNAYVLYSPDIDYIVHRDKIVIVDRYTGRLKERSRWEFGLHTAVEVKEGVSIQKDNNAAAIISLKNYFKLYTKIGGMSGTVLSVSKELLDVYGLQTKSIPTHRPLIRKDKSLQVYKTTEAKDIAIIETIEKYHKKDRPILVGCLSIKRAEEIKSLLDNRGLKNNLLSAKSLEKEAFYIANAGKTKTITVSTSLAGRGTDIKLCSAAHNSGGLVVIGTDLFESSRVDMQLKGRAGRQGDPGTSIFFTSLEDDIMGYLNSDEQRNLKKLVESIPSDNVSLQNIRSYVKKAQSNREEYYFELRTELARKDDVIAPYRFEFYRQRNMILKDRLATDLFFNQATIKEEDKNEIDIQLYSLYTKAKSIFFNLNKYNSSSAKTDLVFSENTQTYVITLDIKEVNNSFDYFKQEFKRQIILLGYDQYWSQFVLHLNSNLDEVEIQVLPYEFFRMKSEINQFILSKLKGSTIPIVENANHGQEDKLNTNIRQTKKSKIKNMNELHDLCSCGSGLNFGECHGKNIRQNYKRRRF